ncbi:Hypothetical protein NGAL_HAMBI2605_09450 [Neorhizobium galegae bv. orientalis]|nr:Hypothetical protein NGAL_HAMBI2605_09450 [Neorhizobium galegae bv. orientalis]
MLSRVAYTGIAVLMLFVAVSLAQSALYFLM